MAVVLALFTGELCRHISMALFYGAIRRLSVRTLNDLELKDSDLCAVREDTAILRFRFPVRKVILSGRRLEERSFRMISMQEVLQRRDDILTVAGQNGAHDLRIFVSVARG